MTPGHAVADVGDTGESPAEDLALTLDEEGDKWYSVNGQFTTITQRHDAFPALYSGLRSLPPIYEMRTSATATVFLGARLWRGAEVYFDPESRAARTGRRQRAGRVPQRRNPAVSSVEAQPYIARVWLQQTFGLGGDQERIEAGPNQVAGYKGHLPDHGRCRQDVRHRLVRRQPASATTRAANS